MAERTDYRDLFESILRNFQTGSVIVKEGDGRRGIGFVGQATRFEAPGKTARRRVDLLRLARKLQMPDEELANKLGVTKEQLLNMKSKELLERELQSVRDFYGRRPVRLPEIFGSDID